MIVSTFRIIFYLWYLIVHDSASLLGAPGRWLLVQEIEGSVSILAVLGYTAGSVYNGNVPKLIFCVLSKNAIG